MNSVELDRMELLRLAKQGDFKAQEAFFQQNQGLVRMVVSRFLGRDAEYEDLYQIGCMAFVKAMHNFDLSAGVQFSTYAVPVMLGEIRRHFRDNGAIRVSRGTKEQARSLMALQERLSMEAGREPTLNELAQASGIEPPAVVFALDSLAPVLSLSYAQEEGGSELMELVGEDTTEQLLDRVEISKALSRLNDRERKLVLLRYFRAKTQQETASMLGISQVQVSRLERRALDKLRVYMQA